MTNWLSSNFMANFMSLIKLIIKDFLGFESSSYWTKS